MRKPKITVIGAGDVGAATARCLADERLGEIVFIGRHDDAPGGSGPDGDLPVADDDAAAGSSIVVVALEPEASAPGSGELRGVGLTAVSEAVSRAVRKSRDSIIIMLSQPVCVMCEVARRASRFPRQRVLGVAGALDAALARALRAADPSAADEGARRRAAGPAAGARVAAAVEIVDAVVNDRKRILPCAVFLQGEYGVTGVFVGVPARVGAGGLVGVVEFPLTGEETAQLQRSAADAAAQAAALPAVLGPA